MTVAYSLPMLTNEGKRMTLTSEEEKLILGFRVISKDCQNLVKAIIESAKTNNTEDKIIYLEKFLANK